MKTNELFQQGKDKVYNKYQSGFGYKKQKQKTLFLERAIHQMSVTLRRL